MVGCKDDPAHKRRRLRKFHLQSPTQDERDAHLANWLQHLPPAEPISPRPLPLISRQEPDSQALHPPHKYPPHPSKKRKALTELDPFLTRKSARLAQKQGGSGCKMPRSPTKKKPAGKDAGEGIIRGQEADDDRMVTRGMARKTARGGAAHGPGASGDMMITREGKHAQLPGPSSSNKENRGSTQDSSLSPSENEDAGTAIPLLAPLAVFDLGSGFPPKRTKSSSRPASPTKTTSSKLSKGPAHLGSKEILATFNPPVEFFSFAHLRTLGENMPALLRDLWVNYIKSNGEGFIPQALRVRYSFLAPTDADADTLSLTRRKYLRRPRIKSHQRSVPLALQPRLVTPKSTAKEFGSP